MKHCLVNNCYSSDSIYFDLAIVYYDIKCCLCSAIVKNISNKAHKKGIVFLDLDKYRSNNYTNSPSNDLASIDSILYTEGKTISIYSDAVSRLLIYLGGIYKFFGCLLKTIPKRYRDGLYKIIAKNRYRIFGEVNCQTN